MKRAQCFNFGLFYFFQSFYCDWRLFWNAETVAVQDQVRFIVS